MPPMAVTPTITPTPTLLTFALRAAFSLLTLLRLSLLRMLSLWPRVRPAIRMFRLRALRRLHVLLQSRA
jgi:hypothetical protein